MARMRFYVTAISAGLSATLAGPAFADPGARPIEMVRLDTKDPGAHNGAGAKEQAKSDLSQVITYYNAAIKHDPKDDDAYFHRGIANYYAGALPQALADLGQASKIDPEYPYYALWIDILDKRANAASRLPQT